MASVYGECNICGCDLEPVLFIEDEIKTSNGIIHYTGRTRLAVSHLQCPRCRHKEIVDDSFDGEWR